MKLHIASDLHIEHFRDRFAVARALPTAPGADLLILAGDIHSGDKALVEFAGRGVPVIMIGGNHESWGHRRASLSEGTIRTAAGSGIDFLECGSRTFPGVRVLGCTLWTDYNLYGNPTLGKLAANLSMYDHKLIQGEAARAFTPDDAHTCHKRSRRWLESELQKPFDGKTVVVTHHGPHPDGIADEYRANPLNPAFFSDLRSLMPAVDLWVHGHTHSPVDIQEGRCRVLCNPRGYPLNVGGARTFDEVVFENKHFDPQLLVEV